VTVSKHLNPIAIHAFNPGPMTGDGNWTWLLPGPVATLIDAGTGAPQHLAALEQALGQSRLAQMLVTHAHVDHASGAPAIASRMPGVRARKRPWPERDSRWLVSWEPIHDSEIIPAGATSLVAVHTPGHAPDHLCFWHEETRSLFSRALVVLGATVRIPSSRGGDLSDYLSSLGRVLALEPVRLLPAHGPVIDEPEPLLRGYIEHRLQREEQVLDALRRGDTTPDEIVSRVYKDIQESLVAVARETVLSHLVKLERERRVSRDGEVWQIRSPQV
jgi:glyoxylase-like metal-dependent hydrolase (beta-lactamase superfamily II)